MYFGSLFTTFCWHNEDNYMYSINYHHKGAPKQWYGVSGDKKSAEGLERVFKNYLSMKMRDVPDLLHHITTMFSPRLLQNADVVVSKVLQHEGEFVVSVMRSSLQMTERLSLFLSYIPAYYRSHFRERIMEVSAWARTLVRQSTLQRRIGFLLDPKQMNGTARFLVLLFFRMTVLPSPWPIISKM